jgi:hypothetical protein
MIMKEKHHRFIKTEFDPRHKNTPIVATLVFKNMTLHATCSQGMMMEITESNGSPAEGVSVYVDAYNISKLVEGGHYGPVTNSLGKTTQGLINAEFYFYKKKSFGTYYNNQDYYDAISISAVQGRNVA